MKYKIIPIFVPHGGCPHMCSFCNQRHITGQVEETTPEAAEEIIEKYLATIDTERFITEIAFYGGSFTAIDVDKQNALLDVANIYKQQGKCKGIRLSTRPDCIDDEILSNLKRRGVTEIELGVQSMCDDVLKANRRGHTAADVETAARCVKEYGFTLGLQMMTGLIKDSYKKTIYTARSIAKLSPDFVRIYPALVFENTELYEKYTAGEYQPQTVEQAIEVCAAACEIFENYSIPVIRLGLLLSGEEAKNNFVAGPYHPRFGEIVKYALKELRGAGV